MGHIAQNEVKVSDRKKEAVIAPELHSQFIEFLGAVSMMESGLGKTLIFRTTKESGAMWSTL